MTDPNRVAGTIEVALDAGKLSAGGSFSYDLGFSKREGVVGPDEHHGYSEKPKVAYIEGVIIVKPDVSITDICTGTNKTVTLTLATGKIIQLGDAYYAGDNTGDTDAGTLQVRWEGMRPQEV